MQYFILLSLPVLLCLSIIVIVILCFKKKWKVASVLMIVVLLFNWYFKIYAINFHSQSDSGNRFRILSYNIHSQGAYLDTSRYNPHILFEVIKKIDSDVILFQEYDTNRCAILRDSLLCLYPHFHYTVGTRSYGQNAIFSKYPIKSVSNISKNELINFYCIDYNSLPISIVNCHLKSNNIGQLLQASKTKLVFFIKPKIYYSKLQQAKVIRSNQSLLISKAINSDVPFIVGGDFNDVCGSNCLSTLENKNLRDSWWFGGFGFGITYSDFNLLKFRLDHILYSDHFKCLYSEVQKENFSDHSLLISTFRIKK
jgi:endonuclease/exonuclease/phosphatase family metal-dependent hydrolase